MVISLAQDELGWPEPVVYADAGQPGGQLADLVEAITAGRHDGVFATHPSQLGDDLAQIEAFDQLCREHGVRLGFRWHQEVTDTRALFDVIRRVKEFTVTDEHLLLLRHAHVFWYEAEFGAPSIDAEWRFLRLHVETAIALQIALATGEFRTGRYVRDDKWDSRSWRRGET